MQQIVLDNKNIMNYYILLIAIFFTVISCSSKLPMAKNKDVFDKKKVSVEIPCKYGDTILNENFILNDSESFSLVFKFDIRDASNYQISDLLYFKNKYSSEYIGLTENYGGRINEFKSIVVEYIPKGDTNYIPLAERHFKELYKDSYKFNFIPCELSEFKTKSGIKLGISEKHFNTIYRGGRLFKTQEGSRVVYSFNPKQEVYFCEYFSKFIFENDILISFSLGYVTP